MIMVHHYLTVIHDQTKSQMSFKRIGWVFKHKSLHKYVHHQILAKAIIDLF